MQAIDIHHFELILLFIVALIVAFAALARRLQTPYPIVLVMGGLTVSLLPNMPRVDLNSDVIFLVLLPPLLFAAAFHTSWRSFRAGLPRIAFMAFGLAGFSVAAVAYATGLLLPGFDLRVGFVLGALVAGTDAVAATAIARRMHLPRRISDLVEGESLLNDATSLLALEFSVAMLVNNTVPSFQEGALRLLYLVVAGVLLGMVSGWLIHRCQVLITDAPLEVTLTLIAPYVAYLAAESAHASGVLATVACGLYLGEKQSESLSVPARTEMSAIWGTLDFVLNGIVFTLVGLQLPYVLQGIQGVRLTELLIDAGFLVAILIALRLIWVFGASWIVFGFSRLIGRPTARPRHRESLIIGWTGMRGVITLAAAMSVPETIYNGAAFPQRDTLIFLCFCVILATLVGQGLSLPPLIRRLGLSPARADK